VRLRDVGSSIVVDAPAKLNLYLEVLGKRSDGFHDLETVMVTVDLYDTLSFKEVKEDAIRLRCINAGCRGTVTRRSLELPSGRDNLVVQAASLLKQKTGTPRGAEIRLWKRIPSAAGLAGGSSDAASTLFALNRLWDIGLSRDDLVELASQIGSDVPFFLAPEAAAVCRGRGELIEPISIPLCLHAVIVRPGTGLSTPDVFRACRPAGRGGLSASPLVDALVAGRIHRAASLLHNRLQAPAERLNAEVEHLKFVFSKQPVLGHMMSGSGSAWFGLCPNRSSAQAVAARLASLRIGRVYVAQSRP
jgi:4-diphosphocytidyl-2-C-methyl-D-erythritol kinase